MSDKIQEINVYSVPFYNNKVLVAKRTNGLWEFPGGSVDFGEAPVDSAKRELMEETGLACSELDFLCITSATYRKEGKTKHAIYIVYKTNVESENVKLSHEHVEFMWVSVPELKFLKLGLNAELVLNYL